MLRKITKKMVKQAFSSEEGMDKLIDKIFELVNITEQLEKQVMNQFNEIEQLARENSLFREENQLLQFALNKELTHTDY